MKFFINELDMPYNFEPFYNKIEQSFFTKPDAFNEFVIMIKGAYTSLDVSLLSSNVYCISGVNPQHNWYKAKLSLPKAIKGSLQVEFDEVVIPGTGIDYATDWKTYYDHETGIICMGEPTFIGQVSNVEFTCNTIASVLNQELIAVWIKPKFVP